MFDIILNSPTGLVLLYALSIRLIKRMINQGSEKTTHFHHNQLAIPLAKAFKNVQHVT